VTFLSRNIISTILVVVCCSALAAHAKDHAELKDSAWRHGQIDLPQGRFMWKMGLQRVEIADDSGRCVFAAEDLDQDSLALSCGHAADLGFTAFFVRTEPHTGLRRLKLISSRQGPMDHILYPANIFSPVLATDHGKVVFAVTENFEIVAWELETGRLIWKKVFETPVVFPELTRIQGHEALQFFRFQNGRYRRYHFFTGPTLPPEIICDPVTKSPEPKTLVPDTTGPDPNRILAFGDSITYGYVNKTPAPDLGYVPRLTDLLHPEYMDIVLINAGNPGETTLRAMDRYDWVLSNSNAAYLLFHQGINDTIHPGTIPVSTTLFNISTIMRRALELDMQPVLSTIIPRDPSHWSGTGIYRTRAKAIREGILLLAADMSLPAIDFWTMFENYPLNNGGYLSLMSDYVHPSEKGYQLMAEHWHQTLLDIPPGTPDDLSVTAATPWRITVTWQPRPEFDMADYIVLYGNSAQNLDNQVVVTRPQTTLLRPPFQTGLQRERWVQVFARDRYGNTGAGSAITRISFPLSATSAKEVTNQKEIPIVKRMPLKRDDKADALR